LLRLNFAIFQVKPISVVRVPGQHIRSRAGLNVPNHSDALSGRRAINGSSDRPGARRGRIQGMLILGGKEMRRLFRGESQQTVLIYSPLDWTRGTNLARRMVEAGGIEPPSEGLPSDMTTCLAAVLLSLFEPPTAGSLRAIRFGSRPHPLRQENRPIPLNDILSNPVGESR